MTETLIQFVDIQPAERAMLSPPPSVDAVEWIEKNFYLSATTSAITGLYSFEYTPFFVEPMRRYSRPPCEVMLEACTQSGKSTIMNAAVGYDYDGKRPGPGGFLMPRESDVKRRVNTRLKQMFRDNVSLFRLIDFDERNLLIGKETVFANGAMLVLAWSTSPAAMADNPIRDVKIDEPGKMAVIQSTGESPFDLFRRRQRTFKDSRTLLAGSSPQDEGDLYDNEMRSGTDERWHACCVVCGKWHMESFDHVVIEKQPDGGFYPAQAYMTGLAKAHYTCPHCKMPYTELQRWDSMRGGKFVPKCQTLTPGGTLTGKAPMTNRFSYRITAVMLHPRFQSMAELAAEYVQAIDEQKHGNPAKLKDFVRNQLAQPWRQVGRSVDAGVLETKIVETEPGTVPDWVKVIVAAADVHEDQEGNLRIDYAVKGWAEDQRNHKILSGHAASFEQLAAVTTHASFDWADPKKTDKQLMMTVGFIDSGYLTNRVYDFCAQYKNIWYPVKGFPSLSVPILKSDLETVMENRRKKQVLRRKKTQEYEGMSLLKLDTGYFKSIVADMIEAPVGSAYTTTFDRGTTPDYLIQLTNEHRVKQVRGNFVHWGWVVKKDGLPTHALDLEVYSTAAAYFLNLQYLLSEGEKQRRAEALAQRRQPMRRTRLSEKPRRRV